MELTDEEKIISAQACAFIAERKNELIEKFILDKNPLQIGFITIFMAGSPGAGKTEFSLRYMPLLIDKDEKLKEFLNKEEVKIKSFDSLFVRIDVDEIRSFIPQYIKTDT